MTDQQNDNNQDSYEFGESPEYQDENGNWIDPDHDYIIEEADYDDPWFDSNK